VSSKETSFCGFYKGDMVDPGFRTLSLAVSYKTSYRHIVRLLYFSARIHCHFFARLFKASGAVAVCFIDKRPSTRLLSYIKGAGQIYL
jgi:hypothetical protein